MILLENDSSGKRFFWKRLVLETISPLLGTSARVKPAAPDIFQEKLLAAAALARFAPKQLQFPVQASNPSWNEFANLHFGAGLALRNRARLLLF
jgi:hypothetical protein